MLLMPSVTLDQADAIILHVQMNGRSVAVRNSRMFDLDQGEMEAFIGRNTDAIARMPVHTNRATAAFWHARHSNSNRDQDAPPLAVPT